MTAQTDAPIRLLFVCTGNTCRSPMAEAIARHRVEQLGWTRVEVRSAGVGAFDGSPASGGAVRAAAAHGLDLRDHSATHLTREEVVWADLILTMSPSHLVRVIELGAGERAALLPAYASEGATEISPGSVPDPIGGSDEEYEETYRMLDGMIERALERLAQVVEA